jgi:hypothetical protein
MYQMDCSFFPFFPRTMKELHILTYPNSSSFCSMAPKSTGQGRSRSPSRRDQQGDSPSRKSDSSKKSSGSSYESSASVKSKDSRKGPPTHPPIVHPEPAPPGYVRIKGTLVRDQGEKWTPPPREKPGKDEGIVSMISALQISVMYFHYLSCWIAPRATLTRF